MPICKWCDRPTLGGPLPNGYCSSACNIEDLEDRNSRQEETITDMADEITDLKEEVRQLWGKDLR